MNIDWDRIGHDADESPRALLAEFLADADEIETLVIIVSKADKDEPVTKHVRYRTSGDAFSAQALTAFTARAIMRHIEGGD